MPTVTVAFAHSGGRNPLLIGGNNWMDPSVNGTWFLSMTYTDAFGVEHIDRRQRLLSPLHPSVSVTDSVAPLAFDFGGGDTIYDRFPLLPQPPDTGTLAPANSADAYFEAQMTYPDEWSNVNISLGVRTNTHSGWSMAYRGPFYSGSTANAFQMILDPETLPTEVPFDLTGMTDSVPRDFGGSVDPEFEAVARYLSAGGSWMIQNLTKQTLSYTATVAADYGDGQTETRSFSHEVGPSVWVETSNFGVYGQRRILIPFASIATKKGIAVDEESIVTETVITSDGMGGWIHTDEPKIHYYLMPRFDHDYNIMTIPELPSFSFTSSVGKSYPPVKWESRPVANFTGTDGAALDELDEFTLDASRSFDFFGPINSYVWIIHGPGIPLTIPNIETTEPIISVPQITEGSWIVNLQVNSPGRVFGSPKLSRLREKIVTIGGSVSVAYDERRMTWWRLYGHEGQMYVERHLKHEAPDGDGVLVDSGLPGCIARAGAWLYVTSKTGTFYESDDEGQTWSEVMAIAAGVDLIAMEVESDGSTAYHLVKAADGTLQRVLLRRDSSAWIAEAPEAVTGLPESTRRPGSARMSGATILLSAKSDDGVFAATSQDGMKTWVVSA